MIVGSEFLFDVALLHPCCHRRIAGGARQVASCANVVVWLALRTSCDAVPLASRGGLGIRSPPIASRWVARPSFAARLGAFGRHSELIGEVSGPHVDGALSSLEFRLFLVPEEVWRVQGGPV